MFVTYYQRDCGFNDDIFQLFMEGHSVEVPEKTPETWITNWEDHIVKTIPIEKMMKWNNKARKLSIRGLELATRIPTENRFQAYHIPKKSGGTRLIEEPVPEIMDFLRDVKDFLEKDMRFHPHPAAFAYVKKQNTLAAIKVHQQAENKWFLKLDFHNFFGSTNKELLMKSFWNIYPFGKMKTYCNFEKQMNEIFDLAFAKDGHLPQGTPLSPLITNICMLASDFDISCYCNKMNVTYTRYADDLLFSAKDRAFLERMVGFVKQHTPNCYQLNREKTRLGNIAGSNWNLGLMLNKDNNITVGKRKKDVMRATLYNLATKYRQNEEVSYYEEEKTEGLFNYYHNIEPVYFNTLVRRICEKTGVNLYEYLHLNQ